MATKSPTNNEMSPMLKHFYDLKEKHPDALLLFRCGDFYETYDDDAQAASQILGITITRNFKQKDKAGHGLRQAGFPYHALDTYLPKLIRAGRRVAICDQLEDPTTKKVFAQRGITEIVSPEDKKLEGQPTTTTETSTTNNTETMTQEQHNNEIAELKKELHDKLLRMAAETIKALNGSLPSTLNDYYTEALGRLELIKVKIQCRKSKNDIIITDTELSWLVTMAEKGEKVA